MQITTLGERKYGKMGVFPDSPISIMPGAKYKGGGQSDK